MRDIRNYVHLYLGGSCLLDGKYGWISDLDEFGSLTVKLRDADAVSSSYDAITLVLRQFNSITRTELLEWVKISTLPEDLDKITPENVDEVLELIQEDGLDTIDFTAMEDTHIAFEFFRWATSKGFDLFGLITDGLAIDENSLKEAKENV